MGGWKVGSRRVVLAAILAGSGSLLLAQQPNPPQEPVPTFRTGVEAVQLDVFVTDADGRQVADLTAGDFEVLENGVPRPLVAFSRVHLPVEKGLGPTDQWPMAPDVVTNDRPEGRLYLFALDEVSIEPALRARAPATLSRRALRAERHGRRRAHGSRARHERPAVHERPAAVACGL